MGSAAGVVAHNSKAAAIGAAAGGVAGFLASSGIGQEIDLPKGTKLELVLDRPLYLT
jgi:outer membrane lipoprotein SlyB